MIMVVMVGMSVAFVSVVEYTSVYKAGAGSSVLESLTIEDVWLHGTEAGYGNTLTVSVYNSGQIDSIINGIYVNGEAATNGTSNFNFNIPVHVGQHVQITVQWGPGWEKGDSYQLKITTLRGSNFEETITAT